MNQADDMHDLLGATNELKAEVHELGQRLSAKEILAQRTAELTERTAKVADDSAKVAQRNHRLTILCLVLTGIVILGGVVVIRTVNCLADWGDAVSRRNSVLNEKAEFEAFQVGRRDAAMAILVNNRNVDTATTTKAVADWNAADANATAAKQALAQARLEYPPPVLRDYCGWFTGDDHPKDQGRQ